MRYARNATKTDSGKYFFRFFEMREMHHPTSILSLDKNLQEPLRYLDQL